MKGEKNRKRESRERNEGLISTHVRTHTLQLEFLRIFHIHM